VEEADHRAPPETAERAQADLDMSTMLFAERRFRSAWQRAGAAHELASRLGNLEARYRAAAQQLRASSGPGEEQLRALLAELSIGARVGVSPRMLTNFLFEACYSLLGWGDLQEAYRLSQELREIAAKTHYPSAVQRADLIQALASTLAGRWEDTLTRAESFMGQAEELGNPSWAWAQCDYGVTRMRISLGRSDEALTGIDAAIPREGVQAVVRTALRVLCLGALGRLDEARTVAAPLLDPQGLGPEADYAPTYLVAVLLEVAVAIQHREAAARLSAQLSGLSDQVTIRALSATAVGRHLGAAAALLGDLEAARRNYEQALEACEKIRFRPEIALTRLQMAELLLEQYPNERATAMEHLDFAIAEFRDMKMQPSLERALRHKEVLKA
jgi:tetratricopeptide (TPR) repeat protein